MALRRSPDGPARRAAGIFGFIVCLAVFNTQTCSQVVHAGRQTDVAGPWQGQIAVAGVTLDIRVVLKDTPGGLAGTIDIPQQGASGLSLRNVTRDGDRVRFELPAGPGLAVFDGRLEEGRITGTFTQATARGTFTLSPAVAADPKPAAPLEPPPPYRELEVRFASGDASLAGTLTLPEGSGPFPAAALLTGSGPQNRDEELFGFKPFRIIADHLTRRGIAVLRWDDRGVGGSTGAGPDVTTKDVAGDALAAIAWLSAREDIDAAHIGLLGHSEGALAAVIAAAESRDVGFVVLLAGPALPGETILRAQGEALARGKGPAALDAIRRQQDLLFEAVRTGEGWDEVMAVARKNAAAVGDEARFDATIDSQLRMVKSGWYKFFLDYDPAPAIRKVSVPVLALYGALDVQVPAAPNAEALRAAAAAAGNADVTVKTYDGTNHLFIPAKTGLPAEYVTLEKAFVPGLLDDISAWLAERTAR